MWYLIWVLGMAVTASLVVVSVVRSEAKGCFVEADDADKKAGN